MSRISPGDAELIAGLLRGEAHAVEALVDRYGAWIHRVASRLLADARDAEEVTQDVLMTVVRKIDTFKREAALSSWIYRVTANAAYERLRSRRSRIETPLEPLLPVFDDEGRHVARVQDWSRNVDDPAVAAELRAALERGIDGLPEEYRSAVLLSDIEGLTYAEIVEVMGVPLGTVKSRLHAAVVAFGEAYRQAVVESAKRTT